MMEMNKKMPISKIMSTILVTVGSNQVMKDVEDIFEQHNFHYLPVVDGKSLCGVISKSDYLAFKRKFNSDFVENRMDLFRLKKFKVKDVMTKHYTALDVDATIGRAIELFSKNYFHAVPVLDKSELVGVLTTHDLIKYFASL